jgi:hypothetical protein
VGLLVAVLNAYLSFGRPLLYSWRKGSLEGFQRVSGFPGIGTFLVVAAVIVGFGDEPTAWVALAASALDTGGLPWFLICTWRDRWLWDS